MNDKQLIIGLVEDDADQAAVYQQWLQSSGYEVRLFTSGADFRRQLGAESVELVIIDWLLPDVTGMEILDWLRSSGQTHLPIVILTARSREEDIVQGLKAGADDYIVKPARKDEFLARISALLRRSGISSQETVIKDVPPYEIDTVKRRISIEGSAVKLTDKEFELAVFIFKRQGRIVSRETLLGQVWNLSGAVNTRTVDTHMSRLRKKLRLNGELGWQLTAAYQHGYRLERL